MNTAANKLLNRRRLLAAKKEDPAAKDPPKQAPIDADMVIADKDQFKKYLKMQKEQAMVNIKPRSLHKILKDKEVPAIFPKVSSVTNLKKSENDGGPHDLARTQFFRTSQLQKGGIVRSRQPRRQIFSQPEIQMFSSQKYVTSDHRSTRNKP